MNHYFIRWSAGVRLPPGRTLKRDLLIHIKWASCCGDGNAPPHSPYFKFESPDEAQIFFERIKGTNIEMRNTHGTATG